eukprot:GGOE01003536.1.p1 GENE.GGOE01003536.1~~GGOE01003536.1.p1  ORF type:complete len:394 (+),score=105.51 GGOE01003536.1:39-1184(+)
MDRIDLFFDRNEDNQKMHHTLWELCTTITPTWKKVSEDEMKVDLVKGGITNLLYKVTSPVGSLLVRVYGDKTELVINRDKETAMLRQLSDLGFSVPYYGSFGNGRIEEWRNMRPLTPEELGSRSPIDFPTLIAKSLFGMHILKIDEPDNPDNEPKVFHMTEGWARAAQEINFDDSPERQALFARMAVPRMVEELRWLQSVLPSKQNSFGRAFAVQSDEVKAAATSFAFDSVFCHNDMLCGNIIMDEEQNCQLIDFEYGCYNHRAFDIANHFVEYAGFDADWGKWHPIDEQMLHFIKVYVGQAVTSGQLPAFASEADEAAFRQELLRWVQRFCLASHLFWGFWSIIQARHSPIDFDFLNYGRTRFVGYFYCKGLYARDLFQH